MCVRQSLSAPTFKYPKAPGKAKTKPPHRIDTIKQHGTPKPATARHNILSSPTLQPGHGHSIRTAAPREQHDWCRRKQKISSE